MDGFKSLLGPRGWAAFLGIGAILLVGVPLLNLLPASSPLHIPN